MSGCQQGRVEMKPARVQASAYDALAPRFERDRALPEDVPAAIRATVLGAVAAARPRLLDLGAGTGRIGWPFVAAGDEYVGLDLSLGMLQAFVARCERRPYLVQADGHRLPFGDASFDAVLLIQVFGGISDWQKFTSEARRVLRPSGAILIGRTVAPEDGVDARMKQQLDVIVGSQRRGANRRVDVQQLLATSAADTERRIVGSWTVARTPAQFIARHRGGARFSALPERVKDDAMAQLTAWAEGTFGSLDAASAESHRFELQIYRFEGAVA
jgi:SAM-dependent methyltransferase